MKNLLRTTIVTTALFSGVALACTSIAWNTDHGVLTTRTNDWVEPTHPVLANINAGSERYLHGIEGNGETYITKYDILAITAYGGLVHDGVNERGLQVNTLYYGPMSMTDSGTGTISQLAFGEYLIANYADIKQIVADLDNLKTELAEHAAIQPTPLFHWSLTDKSGDRLVIQHDADGLSLYRGDEAAIMTNQPSQQVHLDAWAKAKKAITKTDANTDFGSKGRINAEDRFLHSSYYFEQLKEPTSSMNGLMKLASTAYNIPHDAANREVNGVVAGYATEWQMSTNLTSGEVVFQYMWGDSWTQSSWNFYDMLEGDSTINLPLGSPSTSGDLAAK